LAICNSISGGAVLIEAAAGPLISLSMIENDSGRAGVDGEINVDGEGEGEGEDMYDGVHGV